MALPSTFAPNDVTVVITKNSVVHTVGGFSEDSIVGIAQGSARFEKYIGADNSSTRIYKADTSTSITISLQQTSVSNDFLTQLHLEDVDTRDSSGFFQLTVKDNSGRTLVSSSSAYIAILPDINFSNGMEIREWVVDTFDTDNYIGGNSKFTAGEVTAFEALGSRTVQAEWQD